MKRFVLAGTLALVFTLLAALPALGQAPPTVEYQRYAYDAVSINYCTNELVHYVGFTRPGSSPPLLLTVW